MESVGEFFKQVRETKGLTVDDVASKTRIRPDYVKALEEGNFAKLPDQVFARGFVRSYARSLGLDEEDAMHRFVQSAGAFYDKQEERERLRVKQAEDERRKKANRKVVVAAVGVALLGLVLLLSREQSAVVVTRPVPEPAPFKTKPPVPPPKSAREPVAPPTAQNPLVTVGGETLDADKSTGAEPLPLPPVAAPPKPSAPAEPVVPASHASVPDDKTTQLSIDELGSAGVPLVLELEAQELSWVVVQVDGGSPQEALLRGGERAKWKAKDRFTITLGNAGGVRVELNGKPQGPFGPSGKVARDIVLKR